MWEREKNREKQTNTLRQIDRQRLKDRYQTAGSGDHGITIVISFHEVLRALLTLHMMGQWHEGMSRGVRVSPSICLSVCLSISISVKIKNC